MALRCLLVLLLLGLTQAKISPLPAAQIALPICSGSERIASAVASFGKLLFGSCGNYLFAVNVSDPTSMRILINETLPLQLTLQPLWIVAVYQYFLLHAQSSSSYFFLLFETTEAASYLIGNPVPVGDYFSYLQTSPAGYPLVISSNGTILTLSLNCGGLYYSIFEIIPAPQNSRPSSGFLRSKSTSFVAWEAEPSSMWAYSPSFSLTSKLTLPDSVSLYATFPSAGNLVPAVFSFSSSPLLTVSNLNEADCSLSGSAQFPLAGWTGADSELAILSTGAYTYLGIISSSPVVLQVAYSESLQIAPTVQTTTLPNSTTVQAFAACTDALFVVARDATGVASVFSYVLSS